MIDNIAYIAFGSNYENSGIVSYNLETKEKKVLTSSRRKPAQTILDNIKNFRIHNMVVFNDKLYFVTKTNNIDNTFEYNPKTNNWRHIVKAFSWRGLKFKVNNNSILLDEGGFISNDIKTLIPIFKYGNYKKAPNKNNKGKWNRYYKSTWPISIAYDGENLYTENSRFSSDFGGNARLIYFHKDVNKESIIPLKIKGALEKNVGIDKMVISNKNLIFTLDNKANIYYISKENFNNFYAKKLKRPVIIPNERNLSIKPRKTSRFIDKCMVKMVAKEGSEIRYTIDETIPTKNSLLYTGPFEISKSVIMKARAYKKDKYESDVAEIFFKIIKPKYILYGDWNGDGNKTKAVNEYSDILFDYDNDNQWDKVIRYPGRYAKNQYFAGDYNNDGKDTISWRCGNRIFIDNDLDGKADKNFELGTGKEKYISGDWNGNGIDTVISDQ